MIRFHLLTVCGLLAGAGFWGVRLPAEELNDLVDASSPVAKVAGDYKFTEGPAFSPQGFLVFSDIPNSRIVRFDADGTTADFLNPSGRANGLVFDSSGNLYICQGGAGRIAKLPVQDGKLQVLADSYDGKRLNSPNDLALDMFGGLYFTDPRYGSNDPPVEQPVMGVYYINHGGEISRVIEDLERPNGVLVSPDGKSLYVAEPNKRELYRYTIESPGKISGKTLIYTGDAQQDGSGPDGMALDVHGNIYATYAGIVALTPDGKLIGRLPVPERPANCTFGGADGKTLFITARTSLYAQSMKVAGQGLSDVGPRPAATVSIVKPVAPVSGLALSPLGTLAFSAVGVADDAADTKKVKAGDLTLDVPSTWTEEAPANRLRLAQFTIPAAEEGEKSALMVVSFFGGTGGGIEANLNRWVGQFASDGRKSKITKGTSTAGEYYVADIEGTYNEPVGPPVLRQTRPVPGSRMIAVILSVKDRGNYFLKLTGPQETVATAANDMRKLIGADPKAEETVKGDDE